MSDKEQRYIELNKKLASLSGYDPTLYMNTLQDGLHLLCEAMGVDAETYDRDKADTECYMDCFRDAAKAIKGV